MTISRRRAIRFVVAVAVLLASLAVGAVPSRAASGTYTQMLCSNPDTGQGVAANGPLPSGLTVQAVGNPSYLVAEGTTSCGPGPMFNSRGVLMQSGSNYDTATSGTGFGALIYTPAPNTSVVHDDLYLAANLETPDWHETVTVHGGAWNAIFATPVLMRCEWAEGGCVSFGSLSDPYAAANHLYWATPPADGFAITMGCDIPVGPGWACHAGNQILMLYGAKITLRDESNPVAGPPATGGLVSEDPVLGTEDVTVTGTDVGSGLYRLLVLVDNRVTQIQSIDTNGGSCVDINPANADPYEFARNRPCKLSAGGTYAFDTRSVPDGRHNIKVQMEDAGGNATTMLDRTVAVRNTPVATGVPTPQSVGGVSTPTDTSQAPSSGDVPAAVPRISSRKRVVHLAHGRSIALSGRVTTATGEPAGGVKIDVLHGPTATSALVKDLQVTSGNDGVFVYVVPAGVSRVVRFGIRANPGDADFARTVSIRVRVRAGVSLHLSRSHLRNGQTLLYRGLLLGPSNRGRFVEIQVRNGRQWQVICSLRTSRTGRFTCAHHFTRTFASTTYAFRAVVPAQSGFPYDPAHSATRKVHVRP